MPAVLKEMSKLPKPIQRQIDERIQQLAEVPRPPGCVALQGNTWGGHARIRSGDYRIIYRIEDDRLIVTVIKVRNRRDIYER